MFTYISETNQARLCVRSSYRFAGNSTDMGPHLKPDAASYDEQFFTELLRKQQGSEEDFIAAKQATNEGFLLQERNNAKYAVLFPALLKDRKAKRIFNLLRIELKYILGDRPLLDVPSRYTSGATTSCKSGNTPVHRWREPEITERLRDFILENYIGLDYVFPVTASEVNIVGGGKYAQVPKTWAENRSIIIPPVCNVTQERMYGEEIRSRLKNRGLDIRTAAEKHKMLAFLGSLCWSMINTDDVKNASNSIVTCLVKYIVPPMWFDALDAARVHSVHMPDVDEPGSYRPLQMFMGNGCGFCFELETAIFAAIIKVGYRLSGVSTGDNYRDIHVYGDDMIYDTRATEAVRGIMRLCGFTTHVDKSFSRGTFRESCGGDYLNGLAVRPVHLKSRLETDRERVVFLNQITRMRLLNSERYTEEVHMVYCEVLSSFDDPKNIFFGPQYMGDSVLQCPPFVDFKEPPPDKWGRSQIKIWTSSPLNVECFETFGHKLSFRALMFLGAGGHLKGLGCQQVSLLHKGVSLAGSKGYNSHGYPMVARPGTDYKDRVTKTWYFENAGLVDETDPVNSVFQTLFERRQFKMPPLANSEIFSKRKQHCAALVQRYSLLLKDKRLHAEVSAEIDAIVTGKQIGRAHV